MTGFLIIGLLMGMRHALDADHLAAIASLAATERTMAGSLRLGVAWGAGHSATLLVFGSLVVFADSGVSREAAAWLEIAVALMLVLLGADLVRRVIVERVHFHTHGHSNGLRHFHAHSHAGEGERHPDPARHEHRHGMPLRAVLIGLVHGMAGSAALALVAISHVDSIVTGLAYIVLFGIGSTIGMGFLSVAIAAPLSHCSAKGLTLVNNGFQAVVGVTTIVIGVAMFPRWPL